MFGLPLYSEFIQGSAIRTWNCVAQLANLIWQRFSAFHQPIMPRSRRRHHSRSRSRSRSHSHERDREPKRRKIESYESPHHRKSVSSEPEAKENTDLTTTTPTIEDVGHEITNELGDIRTSSNDETTTIEISNKKSDRTNSSKENEEDSKMESEDTASKDTKPSTDYEVDSKMGSKIEISSKDTRSSKDNEVVSKMDSEIDTLENPTNKADSKMDSKASETNEPKDIKVSNETKISSQASTSENKKSNEKSEESEDIIIIEDDKNLEKLSLATKKASDLKVTPKKAMSPKQVQKKLESEKKRVERQKERDERERKRQEDRDEKKRIKEKQRLEKDAEKQKEKEQKDKEREMKRKEKEEKDEQKRKEKEEEKLKKQKEIDEKNREKQKLEEKKQKISAAFVNFFVPKKNETSDDRKRDETTSSFMPFEVKLDMRLAPIRRKLLSETAKEIFDQEFCEQKMSVSYLDELKTKVIGKDGKTWPFDDGSDDVTILEDLGESILEEKPKLEKMKAKFLKFHENKRPAYFGTWRKKSKFISPRKPLGVDSETFNYEVDSEDEWEEEVDGESITGSDKEEENESENDNDYEEDNQIFVPHGYLSDDEGMDDENTTKVDPEAQKAKLKLLKNQFDDEMKSKTQKLKPRLIGCIWYNQNKVVDEAIDRYLQPLSIIANETIIIRDRTDPAFQVKKQEAKGMDKELIPDFLRLIHGNKHKKMFMVREYLAYLDKQNINVGVSKVGMAKQINALASYMKCPDEGIMYNKLCWYVSEDIRHEYNVKLELPNNWKYITKAL